MNRRLDGLREALERLGLSCLVVTGVENVRYLSGFSGSSGAAVVTPERSVLVTDGRYKDQVTGESPSWETVIYTGKMTEAVAGVLPRGGAVGFETGVSYRFWRELAEALPGGASLEPAEQVVESLRSVKDDGEITLIRGALSCAAIGFRQLTPRVRPGISERELAAEIDYRMVLAGADGPAFDTVVASGPNSCLPHAGITDRVLRGGDLTVVDFGARKDGYRSDTTRTFLLGETGGREGRVIEAVLGAVRAALDSLEPGVNASRVDGAAREYLEKEGLSGYFSHSLGHGVGLQAHEKPTLSARSDDKLLPGMVFTVEPGVYIEGLGGVRIEEMVLMTDTGFEVMSTEIAL